MAYRKKAHFVNIYFFRFCLILWFVARTASAFKYAKFPTISVRH